MNVPMGILIATAILSLAAFSLRARSTLAAWIGAGGLLIVGLLIILLPLEEAVNLVGLPLKFESRFILLGRALVVDQTTRGMVGLIYLMAAPILALSASVDANRFFPALSILLTGLLASALMIRPFIYAAILLELAAMLAVLILVAPEYPARRSAMRLVFVYSLGMMAILLAGWLLEVVGVTGATPGTARWTAGLLALGFAVLMAIPPFHYWLSAAADESNPFLVAALLLQLQTVGLFFLLQFLDAYEWLRLQQDVFRALRLVGMGMLWFGGVMSLGQRRMARTIVYLMIADMGVLVIAVGMGTVSGYEMALQLGVARIPGMLIWAASAAGFIVREGDDLAETLEGSAHRHSSLAIFLLLGLCSALGVPLTAVFPARWAMLEFLGSLDPLATLSLLLAWAWGAVVLLRWIFILLRGRRDEKVRLDFSRAEIVLVTGAASILLLGLLPQLLMPWVAFAGQGLPLLIP